MSNQNLTLTALPSENLSGDLTVPGDKSISHRSIIFGAIANGQTEVSGFLDGEDCLATLKAFQQLGVTIEHPSPGELIIHGVGKHGLKTPETLVNLGNSGTSIRLLSGLFAGAGLNVELSGDESLNKRPMRRVVEPLILMGAKISTTADGTAPLRIQSGHTLHGIEYQSPIASAQVKSCLLLAGLYAEGSTTIIEPDVTRDHTERMLQAFGYPVEQAGLVTTVNNNHELTATNIAVPGDISSAAFFLVAGSIAKQGKLTIKNVGLNPTRIGVINILKLMGAKLSLSNQRSVGAEQVADIDVIPATLSGIEIPLEQVSLAIDEFPALFIAAACAKGKSILRGAKELRVKESDRITSMAKGLAQLGIEVEELDDGIIITGGTLGGGEVDSFTDHRVAMAFAVASVATSAPITVRNCNNIMTSFPSFIETCQSVGVCLSTERT